MKSSLRVDEFENETDQELNQALAELMGEFTPIPEGYTSEYAGSTLYAVDPLRNLEACHPDYTDNWEQLMELSSLRLRGSAHQKNIVPNILHSMSPAI